MAGEIARLDAAIRDLQGKIAAEAREIEAARTRLEHDPYLARGRMTGALGRKGAFEQQLARLQYERRCQTPAGAPDREKMRDGACWLPRGH